VGTVGDTLAGLLPLIDERSDSSHLERILAHYRHARANLDKLSESGPGTRMIHPQYVNRVISDLADDDAIFSCDVGTPVVWAARYLKMNGRRRLVGSFNHGSMANAMLQAIGAQAAFPGRQVISLSGDGGFTMMMGDFVTLTQHKLPVKIVVLNNGTLGFVELEMKASGLLDVGCDLENPNFAAMAQAMGIKGVRVEAPQDVHAAVEEVLRHDGPALLDVVSARQELVMPPAITFDEAHKFGVFMLKAVLDGRAGELIDLGRVNVLR
jgi:pyruvate dehydrogenase (quinone)